MESGGWCWHRSREAQRETESAAELQLRASYQNAGDDFVSQAGAVGIVTRFQGRVRGSGQSKW